MSPTSPADADELRRLLQQTAEADSQAFAQLYQRTSPKVFGLCLRMLRDRGEAEDVLQDIYITVWRRAETFDATRAGAMTWLISLSRNKVIDRLRQRRQETSESAETLEQLADEGPSPATSAENSEEYARLLHCLEQLEPQQRRSVREAFFSGATYSELAARCQVPLGTMKSWIRRSLIQLRSCLET